MFSKACEYAIRGALHIARATARDERATVKDVAKCIGAPEAFTGKVLQQMVHGGLIASMRGPGGGFTLTGSRARSLTLEAIVRCMDGDSVFTRCALGLPQCSGRKPCPVHDQFSAVRAGLREMLSNTTIGELVERLGAEAGSFNIKG
ncbi:MAG: Rrf2 family transcriptional regulator [Flavobacteriales bacterium]|nr:Rrf2 family transcriptional regulator [Flavobacteriales bacterium]